MGTNDALNIYRALRAAGREPFLFLSAGAHPEAKTTTIAYDPVRELRVHGEATIRALPDGAPERVEDPLATLQDELDAGARDEQGFHGGWAGYFGYEALVFAEPSLAAERGELPEMLLREFTGAVTIHADGRIEGMPDVPAHDGPQDPLRTCGGRWEPATDQARFEASVEQLKHLIREGDHYQTNLSTRFRTRFQADPADVLQSLVDSNPSPYMALLEFDGAAIVSCSPELLLAKEGGVLRTRPIAGTRPRGRTVAEDLAQEQDLLEDAKEDAEHTMLVDLLRNDVARVCEPGSVHVPEQKSVERYNHVMHLVSRVEGRTDAPFTEIWRALFPGGTITGAPKHRACQRIHAHEPVPRGPYTGSAGWIGRGGDACFNILIRTMVMHDGVADVHAGSGIVADSDPTREWQEAGHKAQALLEAAQGTRSGSRDRLGQLTRHGSWEPPAPTRCVDARVLLVDNYDSFTHNLAQYMGALGAQVIVQRNDEVDLSCAPTHIVLSPGPGRPEDACATMNMANGQHGLPVLGVCLGHQAIGLAHGARVVEKEPVHGKRARILHDGQGFLEGLPSPFSATRYHSLVLQDLPTDLEAIAWLEDGTVMAMQHKHLPLWGVQFHPESLMSEHGMDILGRFLE